MAALCFLWAVCRPVGLINVLLSGEVSVSFGDPGSGFSREITF